jgi:hypothetical protein
MKKIFSVFLTVMVITATMLAGCANNTVNSSSENTAENTTENANIDQIQAGEEIQKGPKGDPQRGNQIAVNAINAIPQGELSKEEADGLLWMREEEKLARDVYLTLYEKWQIPIFKNIAGSEQTHTDMVAVLITKYNLTDPVVNDKVGSFTNPKMQELYNKLVEDGSSSSEAALKVGAMIEEIDIVDLQKQLNVTDNEDIKYVYENLLKGSRNHLRSFVSVIKRNYGITYEPQYLDEEDYENIINSSMETGYQG